MKTKPFAFVLIVLFTFFSTSGQYLYKVGAANLSLDVGALITNYYVIGGLAFYFIAAVLLMTALKNGQLSVIYPFIALGFVWVALVANYFLGEALLLANWIGITLIVGGVTLIGYGAEHG